VVEPDLVQRLEALPEERILDYFWLMFRKGADRLDLLQQLTVIIVARPPSWNRKEVRREHEAGNATIRLEKRCCFACQRGHQRLYFHHVLEVQNGGSNQARNLVPLCFTCHKVLHPWLKEPPAQTGFVQVKDLRPSEILLPIDRDGVA
jgi:HNH endonuclease